MKDYTKVGNRSGKLGYRTRASFRCANCFEVQKTKFAKARSKKK